MRQTSDITDVRNTAAPQNKTCNKICAPPQKPDSQKTTATLDYIDIILLCTDNSKSVYFKKFSQISTNADTIDVSFLPNKKNLRFLQNLLIILLTILQSVI